MRYVLGHRGLRVIFLFLSSRAQSKNLVIASAYPSSWTCFRISCFLGGIAGHSSTTLTNHARNDVSVFAMTLLQCPSFTKKTCKLFYRFTRLYYSISYRWGYYIILMQKDSLLPVCLLSSDLIAYLPKKVLYSHAPKRMPTPMNPTTNNRIFPW